jgi:hypothetical protein
LRAQVGGLLAQAGILAAWLLIARLPAWLISLLLMIAPARCSIPQPQPGTRPAACPLLPAGDWRRDAAIQVFMMALNPAQTPLGAAVELEQQLYEDYRNPGGLSAVAVHALPCRV